MKKGICIIVLVLSIVLVSSFAYAQDVSFTLKWVAPSNNADGTPLVDLGNYKLYYGNAADALTSTQLIAPDVISYDMMLPQGVWYFNLTAIDMLGNESNPSNTVGRLKLDLVLTVE